MATFRTRRNRRQVLYNQPGAEFVPPKPPTMYTQQKTCLIQPFQILPLAADWTNIAPALDPGDADALNNDVFIVSAYLTLENDTSDGIDFQIRVHQAPSTNFSLFSTTVPANKTSQYYFEWGFRRVADQLVNNWYYTEAQDGRDYESKGIDVATALNNKPLTPLQLQWTTSDTLVTRYASQITGIRYRPLT